MNPLALLLLAGIKPHPDGDPLATYKQGEVRFTQGGRQATWLLSQGSAEEIPGPQPMRMASLTYAPAGSRSSSAAPSFTLTVGTVGGVASIAVLAVEQGPAGSAVFRSGSAQCILRLARLDATAVEGSATCTGSFEGGAAVTQFQFSAAAATLGQRGDPNPPPDRSGPPPPASDRARPLLLEATWTFDVQQPHVGWVKMQVRARYRTEVVRHPHRGWYGARSCLGLVDVPVRWDSLDAGAPFCIRLSYVDGVVVHVTGATTAGETVFDQRPPREPGAGFPDGKISGPVDEGVARIALERRPWAEAVANEEAAGCVVSPDPVLSYAEVRSLPTLSRRWTRPSWDDWANSCTGWVSLEIRVGQE